MRWVVLPPAPGVGRASTPRAASEEAPPDVGRGFTLIELLVAMVIVGVLLALLLPAVGAIRESANQTQCKNHLRQLGLAMLTHHDTHKHFPTNGWGAEWIGDPDLGFDRRQPGGWVYNVLPFIEQTSLRELGRGLDDREKNLQGARLLATALDGLQCPSRRQMDLYPVQEKVRFNNVKPPERVAKCDYAVNGGDVSTIVGKRPTSLKATEVRRFSYPDTWQMTGIGFPFSQVSRAEVRDGSTNTYLLGEKSVYSKEYGSGRALGDQLTMYVGDSDDIRRWTSSPPVPDAEASSTAFGSAHAGGCHFVFCDGSVRFVRYHISPEAHRRLGNRRDGKSIDRSQL